LAVYLWEIAQELLLRGWVNPKVATAFSSFLRCVCIHGDKKEKMKTYIVILMLAFVGLAPFTSNGDDIINYGRAVSATTGERFHLEGKIRQVIEGQGVLIDGSISQGDEIGTTGEFFVRATAAGGEGDIISQAVETDGIYEYTTVQGANARVRAFKICHE
jgi:hypothetical protein